MEVVRDGAETWDAVAKGASPANCGLRRHGGMVAAALTGRSLGRNRSGPSCQDVSPAPAGVRVNVRPDEVMAVGVMWVRMRKALVVLLGAALVAVPLAAAGTLVFSTLAFAQSTASWSPVGGGAGPASAYTLATLDNALYVGTANGNVWKWSGSQWLNVANLEAAIGTTTTVTSLVAVGPTLYAGTTTAGVWSWDGTVWTQVGASSYPSGTSGNALALTTVGSTVYAATDSGVWSWSGTAWTQAGASSYPTGVNGAPLSLTTVSNTVYAGTGGDGVWALNGSAWSQLGAGSYPSGGLDATALMATAGALYAGTGGGVTVWNGTRWSTLTGYNDVFALTTLNGTLYAGTQSNGVAVEPSSGPWTTIGGFYVGAVTGLTVYNGSLFAAGNHLTWMWNGSAWVPVGGPPGSAPSLAVAGGSVYAVSGSLPSGLWSWNGSAWSVGGASSDWSGAAWYAGAQVASVATVSGIVYVNDSSGNVWGSLGAAGWYNVGDLATNATYANCGGFPVRAGSKPLVGTGATVYTLDGCGNVWAWNGQTWTQLGAPPSSNGAESLFVAGGALYATTNTGEVLWTWTGSSWSEVGDFTTSCANAVRALAALNGALYAGIYDCGVWVLNGSAWSPVGNLSNSNGSASVTSLDVLNGSLYAGTSKAGVWALNGSTWSQVGGHTGLTGSAADIQSLAAVGSVLYAGTGAGVWSVSVNAPSLTALAPQAGPIGSPVTLTGSGFGTVVGSVYFQQNTNPPVIVPGSTNAWTDGSVGVTVPSGLPEGQTVSVSVYNTETGLLSNALPFAVSQPMLTGALSFSPPPSSSVSPGQVIPVTFSATDTAGDPIPYAELYASFTPATGGGTAFWGTEPLSATPTPVIADGSGQVVLTYTAPAPEPTGGIDVLTLANALSSPSISQTDNFPLGASGSGSTSSAGLALMAPPGGALMPAVVGMPYSFPLFALGGTTPYTFSVTGGALPAGLSLDSTTGTVSGTPNSTGSSNFTVQVQDSSSPVETASASLSLSVGTTANLGTLQLEVPNPMPPAVAGLPYFFPVLASGGTPPYTFAISSGSLPAGLDLNTQTGAVYGTPTTLGSSTFSISLTDSTTVGTTVRASTSLEVLSTPPLASLPLPFTPPTSLSSGVSLAFPLPPALVGQQVPIFVAVGSSASGPAVGDTVRFTTSGGTLSAASATTNSQGIASVLLTDATAETDTVTFAAAGTTGHASVSFVNPLSSTPALIATGFVPPPSLPGSTEALSASLDGSEVEVVPPTGLSSGIGGFGLILSGLNDPTTVAASVSSVVYGLTQAKQLFNTAPDVSLLGTSAANTATFLADVFSFGNPAGNLTGSLFNDTLTETSTGIEVTLPYDASALPAGAAPEVVWLDSAHSPPVWTNQGVTILKVDASQGTITALLPHLSTYTVVAATSTSNLGSSGGSSSGGSSSTGTSSSATAAQGTIPSTGGTLATADHSLVLTIPAGAFATSVTITATALTSSTAPPSPAGYKAAAVWSFDTGGLEPARPVTATFAFNPSLLGGLSPARLGVYTYDPSTQEWTWVGGTVDTANDTITVSLPHLSTFGLLVNTTVFSDLIGYSWARPSIDLLLGAGIVTGVAAASFDPSGSVTRAQFATMLVRAEGLSPIASGRTPFTDVSSTSSYAPYIAAAYQAGLILGVSPTTFQPNAPISREQMAVILARVLGSSATAGTLSQFKDASSIASWAKSGVEAVVGSGLMAGFPNGTFQPTATSTRAQAAVVIARYLKHIGKA